MGLTTEQKFRAIPTVRVKEFIERYIDANYEQDEWNRGYEQFSFDAGIPSRRLYAIRHLHDANVTFEVVDRILTRLDCIHLWYVSPEDGGFADYYLPDIPPAPAELTPEQRRRNIVDVAKRGARQNGGHWLDYLHARALEEISAEAAA